MSGKCCCVLSGNCGDGQKCDERPETGKPPEPELSAWTAGGDRAGAGAGRSPDPANSQCRESQGTPNTYTASSSDIQRHTGDPGDTDSQSGDILITYTEDTGPSERRG